MHERIGSSPEPTGRRLLGLAGEELAAAHLGRLGYALVARNYRTRWGELDIIAHVPGTLVFVEVKTRRAGGRAGGPLEAVSQAKRTQVRRMAARWLAEVSDRPHVEDLRFDVVGVTVDGQGHLIALEHLQGAF